MDLVQRTSFDNDDPGGGGVGGDVGGVPAWGAPYVSYGQFLTDDAMSAIAQPQLQLGRGRVDVALSGCALRALGRGGWAVNLPIIRNPNRLRFRPLTSGALLQF